MAQINRAPVGIGKSSEVIRATIPFLKGAIQDLDISVCFSGDIKQFQGKLGNQLIGKRMRFFGSMFSTPPRRRFFYVQILDKDGQPALPSNVDISTENSDDTGVNIAYHHLLEGKDAEFRAAISALCNKGNVKAAHIYGMYLRQNKEYAEAEHWLTAAANAGDLEAQYQLGGMILTSNPERRGRSH